MRRRVLLAALLAAGSWASAAFAADVVSSGPDAVTATLYQSAEGYPDVALINETRAVDLPGGEVVLHFDDVASTMIPQTAQITGLPGVVRESDFDYDLFDTATVLRKSIGHPVELVRTPPKSAEIHRFGTLISDQGVVALQMGSEIEVIGCGGPPSRLVMEAPPGLRDKPALSVHLKIAVAGRHTIHLRYLAGGLRWRAVYLATLAKDRHYLALEGRIVIDNTTATSFRHVPTRFVAGDMARLWGTRPPQIRTDRLARSCWGNGRTSDPVFRDFGPSNEGQQIRAMSGAAPMAAKPNGRDVGLERLGDLKLYRLEEPVTIAANQQKLFAFLAFPKVKVEPRYTAVLPLIDVVDAVPAQVSWRSSNRKSSGLGKPLPHGGVTLYASDHSYLGEDALQTEVAEGGEVQLTGRPSGDVLFSDRIVSEERNGKSSDRTYHVTLRNTTGGPAKVMVRSSPVPLRRYSWVSKGKMTTGDAVALTVTLQAHETRVVSFVSSDPI